mgnify:CR=1 FL=1
MKTKIIKSSILIAILGIALWSCKKTDNLPVNQNNKIEPSALNINEFEYIGQQHNDGLDFVYDKLLTLKNDDSKVYSKEEVIELTNQYTIEYYEYIKGDNSFNEAHDIINDSYYNMQTLDQLYNRYENLSSGLTSALNNLDIIISNQNLGLNEIVTKIKELELQANDNLSSSDKIVFFSASTIARYTMNYWNSNSNKWKELFNFETESWYGDAGGADVVGGAAAAVGAAVVNVVIGAGTVAYGAAIIGGGVGSSAYSAIMSFWNWL